MEILNVLLRLNSKYFIHITLLKSSSGTHLSSPFERSPNALPFFRIGYDWSFDDAIARYGCKVYAYDPTMRIGDHFRTEKIQFFSVGLSDVDSEREPGAQGSKGWRTRTLKTIIKEHHHENVSAITL